MNNSGIILQGWFKGAVEYILFITTFFAALSWDDKFLW